MNIEEVESVLLLIIKLPSKWLPKYKIVKFFIKYSNRDNFLTEDMSNLRTTIETSLKRREIFSKIRQGIAIQNLLQVFQNVVGSV